MPDDTAAAVPPAPAPAAPEPSCADRTTWHLTVAYDGTRFHGWQVQPGVRTVQAELEARLRRLCRDPALRLAATSRTDAGVHALDQHVTFVTAPSADLDGERLRTTLNRWLPEDVRVLAAGLAPPAFHARYSARAKAYVYVIHRGETCSPFFARYVWRVPRGLDVEAMRAAAAPLLGEHDFSSFAVNPHRTLDTTVCRLHTVDVAAVGELVCITVLGNAFLYKMVRGIAGYLVHVGLGRADPADTGRVLAAHNRGAAADSAPPQGLFLTRVFFAENEWHGWRPVLPPFRWPDA